MNVRRLAPADAPAYRVLMLDAYARHPDAFTSSAAERAALPPVWWERRLAAGDAAAEHVFGWLDDGRLLGVAGVAFETREKTAHKCTVFGMYVAPDARGAGRAEALLEAALAAARARPGVRIVQLTVTDGNVAACRLYERHGFVAFGVEPFAVAVGDGHVAKRHLWLDLRARG